MSDQIIPLLRKQRFESELEKIKKMKEDGKTKQEILNIIDRRILENEDVEKLFSENQDNELQDTVSKVEDVEQIIQEENSNPEEEVVLEDIDNTKTEEELVEQKPEEEIYSHEELEDYPIDEESLLDDENFYKEDDVIEYPEEDERESILEKFIGNPTEEEKINPLDKQEEFKYLTDEELVDFPEQPFKLYNDEQKQDMIQSIKINGIIQPLVVRPIGDGKYQILSGHNRRICGREAGLKNFPCKIKYGLSDEEAKLYLVDTNLATREKISPMEKAKALLIRKNAYKHDLIKWKIEKGVMEDNLDKVDVRERIKNIENMSDGNIQRYLRLNYLDEGLQDLVDTGKINLKVAENLSFVSKPQQKVIANMIAKNDIKISEAQSKKLKQEENLNKEKIQEIFAKKEQKAEEEKIILKFEVAEISDFFENLDPEYVKQKILEILKETTLN